MEWSDGMLYPVLHRLEKEGSIKSKWVMEGESRPRKYYEITPSGKKVLSSEMEQWMQVNSVIERLWNPKAASN